MSESGSGACFRVEGGRRLSGQIRPQGNKNEAMPVLAAALLTDDPVELENVPPIDDVALLLRIVRELGVRVDQPDIMDASRLTVCAEGEIASDLSMDLCGRLRGSVTLAGPLLARTGRVFLPEPGGDRIGRRRLDTHIQGLCALGAQVDIQPQGFLLTAKRLEGADIWLEEASVTATENVVAAATLAKGTTIVRHAASEPHVQGMCRLLVAMGARIDGIGTNTLTIEGVERLHGASHRVGPDYLEVGSFIALAAVTRSELLIEDADLKNLRMIQMVFERLGIRTFAEEGALRVPKDQEMRVVNDLRGKIPHIADSPWPGFPADMTSVALVTATQCKGTILIHERMFESRLFFVDPLIGMGAKIILCDPHRAVVIGPEQLKGSRMASPDIRAGMAMLIAALCAEGESEIRNIGQIDRGFAKIDERFRALGAGIAREE